LVIPTRAARSVTRMPAGGVSDSSRMWDGRSWVPVAADRRRISASTRLVVRAGSTSLPFERLGEAPTPALAATFQERAALTRFIVDLGLSLP
jgi:hypothetical protein